MMLRTLVVAFFAAVAVSVASAQIHYLTQSRSVSARAVTGPLDLHQATDFGPFSANVSSTGSDGGNSYASQVSTLGPAAINAIGTAFGGKGVVNGYGSASSNFTVTFTTDNDLPFTISGSMSYTSGGLVGAGVSFPFPGGPTFEPSFTGIFRAGEVYTLSCLTNGAIAAGSARLGSFEITLNITGIVANPQSTSFTYQGLLTDAGGQPVNGSRDMGFMLYPASTGGFPFTAMIAAPGVEVSNGLFTVPLDFGAVYDGRERWLEVLVKDGAAYTTLSPRIRISSTPYAAFALAAPWSGITGIPANVLASPWATDGAGIKYIGGNVGIGAGAFTVNDQLHLFSTSSNRLAVESSGVGYAGMRTKTSLHEYFTGTSANEWQVYDNTASASRLRLNASGNLGVGDVNPDQRLTVGGSIQLNTSSSSSAPNYLAFGNVTLPENGDAIAFYRANLATDSSELRLTIGDNLTGDLDYFTIGVTRGTTFSPVFGFRTDGFASKPGGGTWGSLSDPRAKHDITPLQGTLERVLRLHGYEYSYNDDIVKSGRGLPGRQLGLMADEVQQVFPDWIYQDADGMRMISERSTTALMVEALRDLRTEKDKQIEKLEADNAALRARLDRIEKLLGERADSIGR